MVSITFQPTTEDTILFVGGGAVAERRIELFLKEPCQVRIISPTVTARIRQWAALGYITWIERAFTDDDIDYIKASRLLFICTDNHELNEQLYHIGNTHGVWCNRSDCPRDCTFIMPSSIAIGDLHIAISANHVGPRINQLVRQDMSNRYGQLQNAMPRLKIFREEVKLLLPTPEERQQFWRHYLTVETFEAILKGDWMSIEEKLRHAISGIRSKS